MSASLPIVTGAGGPAERWAVDAGASDVAMLTVPPVLHRDRRFDIDVRFVARAFANAASPWLSVLIEVDGDRQWSRRIDAQRAGEVDSLDYHCRRDVPAGQALRIRVVTQVGGALRQRLLIEAEASGPL